MRSFALRFYCNMWQPFRTVHVPPVPWPLQSYILDFPFFVYCPDPRLWLKTTAIADSTDIELGGRPNAIKRCDESCVSTCCVFQRMKRDHIFRTDVAVLIWISPTQPAEYRGNTSTARSPCCPTSARGRRLASKRTGLLADWTSQSCRLARSGL